MTTMEERGQCPQDLVAIFHASFHPTKGNVIDWSMKASDDLNLDGLEYSALPSGLHLVEQDVVYFNKDGQQGVCIFRRRQTAETGHRGFRLSSLGILLARSRRPRPQRHVKALKELIETVYTRMEREGVLEPTDEDWDPARAFFEERKLRRADLGGAGDWAGWSEELDGIYSEPSDSNLTLHLPHLLRILGPSSLTLYKHILGRKRVLIYTLPPVQVACILCHVASDLCFESQVDDSPNSGHLKGKHHEPVNVLGMVTLTDLDRLEAESRTGRGWIACVYFLFDLPIQAVNNLAWMGNWRGNSTMSYSTGNGAENWGSVRLEGDDDLTREGVGKAYVRNVGMGIEGRPASDMGLSAGGTSGGTSKANRRVSAMSWSSGRATVVGTVANGKGKQVTSPEPQLNDSGQIDEVDETYGLEQYHTAEEESRRKNAQLLTTLAILQTFHAHTLFQLSVLKDILTRQGVDGDGDGREKVVLLSPKDMMTFELGPLSSFDARYLEWLVEEYGGEGVRVAIKRGWKDLLVAMLGYG